MSDEDPKKKAPQIKKKADAQGALRMSPEERKKMILDGAVRFFAEHGFGAETRSLSKEIGVSQGLIFRYFGSKYALIEAVYQQNFISRWDVGWETQLRDNSLPIRTRLLRFYLAYLDAIDDRDWIRISMFSGLSDHSLTKRYIETNVNAVLAIISREVLGMQADEDAGRLSLDHVHELVWHLHSSFIYYLIRKHVFQTKVAADHATLVETAVDSFLTGLNGSRIRELPSGTRTG